MKASFRVADKYEVQCYWSLFGLEKYSVEGKEVLRVRDFGLRGSRKFKVGHGQDEHDVEIRMDALPSAKSWIFLGDWIAEAYVDGILLVDDLTPNLRSKVKCVDTVLNYCLIIALGVLLILAFLYGLLRYVIFH